MTSQTLCGFLAAGVIAVAVSQPLFAQSFASGTEGVNGAVPTRRADTLTPLRGPRDLDASRHHIFMRVRGGVLTIDGFTGKVQLNYDIQDQQFLYFFMPGAGTAVLSLAPMPDSVAVKAAFNGSKLAFSAGGHDFVLTSHDVLLRDPNKGRILKEPTEVYVRFDQSARYLDRNAMMGYGPVTSAPYAWPASMPETTASNAHHLVEPPPLPRGILPRVVEAASFSTVSQQGASQ